MVGAGWGALLRCGGGFLAEFGVRPDEGGDDETGDRAEHDPDEEVLVADDFLEPAGGHARDHHTEGHEAGADRVVGGLVFATGDVEHVNHIRCEAEAVAELLEGDAGIDDNKIVGRGVGEVNVDEIRKVDRGDHGGQPIFQAVAGGAESAE